MNDRFIQSVIFDWDRIDDNSYLKEIAAFDGIRQLYFNSPVTFFAGENGSGKSTLLEAIAIAYGFNPEGGTKNYVFSTHDTHSELCGAIRLSKGYQREKWGYFLRAESFYNVATKEEEYADIAHPSARYHQRSHGESFLALAQNNLHANGLYIMDEPEAALSPQRQHPPAGIPRTILHISPHACRYFPLPSLAKWGILFLSQVRVQNLRSASTMLHPRYRRRPAE